MTAVKVQTALGSVPDANAYIDAPSVIAYWAQRGVVLTDSPELDAAIVAATDYIDNNFRFIGRKLLGRSQRTQWPRSGAIDRDLNLVEGIPYEVVEATAEYTKRVVIDGIDLLPDSGQEPLVTQRSEEVGPIKETFHYARPTSPSYPVADNRMRNAGLLRNDSRRLFGDIRRS